LLPLSCCGPPMLDRLGGGGGGGHGNHGGGGDKGKDR